MVSNLADMHEPFDSCGQTHKAPKVSDPRHAPFAQSADVEFCFGGIPRVFLQVAIRKPDFASFFVNRIDHHGNTLSDFKQFARMLDSIPTEFADVNQTVATAQVDKGAEIFDRPYDPVHHLAGFHVGQLFFAFFFAFTFQDSTSTEYQVPTADVGFGH